MSLNNHYFNVLLPYSLRKMEEAHTLRNRDGKLQNNTYVKIKYHLFHALSAAYTDALLKCFNLFIRITIIMFTVMPWSNHLVPFHLLYCSYQYFSNAKMCIFLPTDI